MGSKLEASLVEIIYVFYRGIGHAVSWSGVQIQKGCFTNVKLIAERMDLPCAQAQQSRF